MFSITYTNILPIYYNTLLFVLNLKYIKMRSTKSITVYIYLFMFRKHISIYYHYYYVNSQKIVLFLDYSTDY